MSIEVTVEHIKRDINKACELTQEIIVLANKTEFDDIDALNQNRLKLIEKIFNNDKTKIDKELAQKLFQLNEKAMAVLKQQMALNMKQQQKMRKGNVAHTAYTQHSY